MSRRKQLSSIALHKYRKIWKNRYIKTHKKVQIYNTHVRSILMYNCSTWSSNKTTEKKLDIIHRKQLRTCLNIHYPNTISNDNLYAQTKQCSLATMVKKRRLAHLGHVLRRDTPVRDILQIAMGRKTNKELKADKGSCILKKYKADTNDTRSQRLMTLA